MNFQDVQTRTFGKWILAGEHTVLRGGSALVFPLRSRYLDFHYFFKNLHPLQLQIPNGYPEEFKLLFWSVFEKACQMKGLKPSQFPGLLEMKANIPVGSGLGASASLCVAIARWFQSLQIISTHEAFDFAKSLEDVFHGESSGVDVAVVLSETGLLFKRGMAPEVFVSQWQPNWYLSHCGHKGITKECVQKVQAWGAENPLDFEEVDLRMKKSVELCRKALSEKHPTGVAQLIEALNLGESCFQDWGLVNQPLQDHMMKLRNNGAMALKPTGSGLGGYVLSLWDRKPEVENTEFLQATLLS